MKNKKQILALLLCFAMVVAMIPVAALQTNATTGVTYLVNNDFDSDEFDSEGVLKAELDGGKWTGVANGTAATAGDLSVLKIHTGQLIFTFNEAITDNYVVKFKYQLDGIGIDGTSLNANERFQFFAGTAAGESSSQLHAEIVGYEDRITLRAPSQVNNYIKANNVQQYAQWHDVEFHVSPSANKYQLYIDGVQYGSDYGYYAKQDEGTNLIRFLPKGSNANFDMLLDYVQVYTVPGDIAGATTTYLNDGFDTLHPKWNNSAATVADGVITTNATNPDLVWTFPTGITGNYTVEFKYRLDAVGTDGTAKQEAFALKMGSTTGQSNSQVYLSFTGAVDGAANQDRVKIQTAPAATPKQFGTYGAWHKVKIVVDQTAKTYQLTVDGDVKEFKTSEGEITTNIPLFNTAITEFKTLFFDCDGVSNISLDYLRVYSGEATVAPDESVTEPSEEPTEATTEATTVPEESIPEETVPAETVPQIEGTKTHLNEDYASETDGIATLDAYTTWDLGSNITDNYTVEFKYRLGGDAQEVYYVKIGNSPSNGEAKSQAVMTLTGAATGASLDDRVKINNAQTVYYSNNKGCGLWHTVKIVVSQTAKTYNLYLDDVLQTYNSSTDIPYYGSGDTSCLNQIFFQKSSGTMELDYVKVYTENVNITQQASLGENIHMNLNGSVSSYSGIISMQAEIDGRTVTDNDMSDGFALPIAVAPAEVAEAITLTGKNAAGEVVLSKTYTVAAYLAEVKASDEAAYGAIVDYTLNYAAAAADYFGMTAIEAPSVTMEEVPSALVGDNITITNNGSVETTYRSYDKITGTYTIEFKYQLPSGSKSTVKIGPSIESSNVNVQFTLTGGAGGNDTDRARIDLHFDTNRNFNVYYADKAIGGEHTVKVTVDCENKTFQMWLDGDQVTYDHDGDAETAQISNIPCYTRDGKANETNVWLNAVAFDMGAGTMIVDDFKISSGETVVYEDDFTTFAPKTTNPAASGDAWWVGSGATLNEVEVNPISGFCAGIMLKGATLLLKDKIEVRYYVSVLSGDISDYTLAINGEVVTAKLKDDGSYIITSKGILPQDYADDMVLTITKDAQSVSIAYNPMDYITRMSDKTTDPALLTLLQAMYNYYLCAAAYVA